MAAIDQEKLAGVIVAFTDAIGFGYLYGLTKRDVVREAVDGRTDAEPAPE